MKKVKRAISILLMLVMLAGLLPLGAAADSGLVIAFREPSRAVTSVGPTVATRTYVFYAEGEEVYRIILKNGETLDPPATPEKSGYRFGGWYEDAECTIPFTGFGTVSVTETGTTELYAGFNKIYYLSYLDPNGRVIRTDEAAENESYTFYAEDPLFRIQQIDEVNTGWNDGETVHADGESITVTKDLTLTPEPMVGYFARFFTQGGSFVASERLAPGEKASRPAAPTRQGYAFAGWYSSADGNEPFDFDTAPNANVNIFAHWTPAQAEYLVVYWLEDANCPFGRETYSVAETAVKTGQTESLATYDARSFQYYRLNTEKSNTDVVIKGDGTSQKNVYYDRYSFHIKFVNGSTLIHDAGVCKWGQVVHWLDDCPAIAEAQADGKHWFYSDGINESWVIQETETVGNNPLKRDGGTVTFSLRAMSGDPHLAHYFEQELDGSYVQSSEIYCLAVNRLYHNTDNHQAHSHMVKVSTGEQVSEGWHRYTFGDWPTAEQQSVLFANTTLPRTLDEIKETFPEGTPFYLGFWYDRNRSDIVFETAGGPAVILTDPTLSCEDIPYETDISAYAPANYKKRGSPEPTHKTVDGVEYEFTGWYTDEALVSEFSFTGATMPGGDLLLYAGWTPLSHTVTFDPNGGRLQGPEEVNVPAGQALARPNDPLHDGENWHFLGWTHDRKTYDFSSAVMKDITLVAQWSNDHIYRVEYDPGAGSGSVPTDPNTYLDGSTAVAGSGASLTPPPGERFDCWQDAAGNRYLPGELAPISASAAVDEKITLTAVYVPDEPPTALIYDRNYSSFGVSPAPVSPEDDTESLPSVANNTTVTLRGIRAEEILPGWSFAGWYLEEACSGDAVTEVLVDRNAPTPNKVYAKWVQTMIEIPVTKVWKDNNSSRRPDSVTVTLLANGEDIGKSLVLNAGCDWTGSFDEVPTHAKGRPVSYTVSEKQVPGYAKPVITGSAASGFTVTNTLRSSYSPFTGDNRAWLPWLGLLVLSGAAFGVDAIVRKRKCR